MVEQLQGAPLWPRPATPSLLHRQRHAQGEHLDMPLALAAPQLVHTISRPTSPWTLEKKKLLTLPAPPSPSMHANFKP
eukprot:5643779-Pyramimonas_sp.AAC.1